MTTYKYFSTINMDALSTMDSRWDWVICSIILSFFIL